MVNCYRFKPVRFLKPDRFAYEYNQPGFLLRLFFYLINSKYQLKFKLILRISTGNAETNIPATDVLDIYH
jgi:hypothetical protein